MEGEVDIVFGPCGNWCMSMILQCVLDDRAMRQVTYETELQATTGKQARSTYVM